MQQIIAKDRDTAQTFSPSTSLPLLPVPFRSHLFPSSSLSSVLHRFSYSSFPPSVFAALAQNFHLTILFSPQSPSSLLPTPQSPSSPIIHQRHPDTSLLLSSPTNMKVVLVQTIPHLPTTSFSSVPSHTTDLTAPAGVGERRGTQVEE